MLSDVIRDIISRQPDMEIVGEFSNPLRLLLAAKETGADAVIVELKGSKEPGLCSQLLSECPKVTILGLAFEGSTAFIEQLWPWRRVIANPSEADILHSLRQAIKAPCSPEEGEINVRNNIH
jgi:DNA-binding NarL/FixJ family response regulator